MHKATSIVLAALLIILPVEQVLAQAAQQEAVSVQPTAPTGSAASLFRVPPLSENSARLLGNPSERALLSARFVERPVMQEDSGGGVSTSEVIAGLVVIGAIVGGIYAWGENDNPESFRSSHSVFYGLVFGALVAGGLVVVGVLCSDISCT